MYWHILHMWKHCDQYIFILNILNMLKNSYNTYVVGNFLYSTADLPCGGLNSSKVTNKEMCPQMVKKWVTITHSPSTKI